MIFHIGERCAGSGYARDIHRSVHVALADARAGFRGVLGHIAHTVQAVFAICRAVNGDQSVKALFRRHLVVAVRAVEDVVEAAVRLAEGEKIFCQGVAVFDETAVVQRNPQLTERDHDLRDRFDVGCSPRRKASLAVLHIGQVGHRLVRCGFDRFLVLIFCKRLQCHCGNVHIGIASAGQTPTAVLHLILDDLIDVKLARGLRFCRGVFRNVVVPGVKGNERPDGAVQALPDGLFKIAQRH